MRFVGVKDFEVLLRKQFTKQKCGGGPPRPSSDIVQWYACGLGSASERRITHTEQLRVMPKSAEPPDGQQCLALSATPFPLQIHVEHPHGVRTPLARRSASTSFPSFLNFSHVPRAAIRAMSHPR
jgi:hypothetical protein